MEKHAVVKMKCGCGRDLVKDISATMDAAIEVVAKKKLLKLAVNVRAAEMTLDACREAYQKALDTSIDDLAGMPTDEFLSDGQEMLEG